jgi:hypothetical protein
MTRYKAHDFDNRDVGEMYNYMEARIEALQRRIFELQEENETLRSQQPQRGQTGSSVWQMQTLTERCA